MSADSCLSTELIHSEPAREPQDGPSESRIRRGANGGPENPLKIKRRKRLPIFDNEGSGKQMFYFVDSNSSSREKRAHVMRHHVQEKRKLRKHPQVRNESEKRINRSLRYLPWQQKTLDFQEMEDPESTEVLLPALQVGDTPSSPSTPSQTGNELAILAPEPHSQEPAYTPSPVTILDASRKDPFNSLPLCAPVDMELADYWANKLSYWSGQNKWMKDVVFKGSMDHPLSFQAVVLSYCARWKAQLYNQSNISEVKYYLGCARKSIDDAIKGHVQIDSDGLAMALAGMALQEDRFGSKDEARKYEDRAVEILRTRTRSSSVAEVFFHYSRCVMMPPPSPVVEDRQEYLVTFLRMAEELMLAHSTDTFLTSVPQRCEAFQMDGPLFPLLSSGPRPSQVPHDSRIFVVRNVPTQEVTRTAALIYITTTLWDLQNSPSKTARFLTHLHNIVKEHNLDRYPACETFIWLLLEESCDSDLKDPERGWSTGELLKMHKQLRPDLQFQYNETLLSLLMLTPPIRGVDTFEKELCPSLVEDESDR
ncbi:hypothetical protein AOCH_005299 [Aspergillus ochraceoroseus]|uniref:Uncharacterized protein n=1 Tax=Aspergillus ochraceoroseus TaxID=138278 RepID=A0A0F8WXD8_9EURO|nr:hypothetical protein AOCH_005299 [Aspergillus ochraceoroseus]